VRDLTLPKDDCGSMIPDLHLSLDEARIFPCVLK
jgi:hypothetical protein